MFHHFHGREHPVSQGSISGESLERFIEARDPDTLLNPDEWLSKWSQGRLLPGEYCLTFDDNLKCQADIALPVLRKFDRKAFWFVYTSPYEGTPERLEVYRYFRTVRFDSMDQFYTAFYAFCNTTPLGDKIAVSVRRFPEDYLSQYTFYTREDRVFRFVRDQVLGQDPYYEVMDGMLRSFGFDIEAVSHRLWMDQSTLSQLAREGHHLGLHSHTHPTQMVKLSKASQRNEYARNKEVLEAFTGYPITSMSHPCNSYSYDTLAVLAELGIHHGFRADPFLSSGYGPLELPRIDHAELIP